MADDSALRALLDREEIRDVLFRYCRAVDRRDLELFRSVYHPDAVHEHGSHAQKGQDFAKLVVDSMVRFAATTHFLTNHRIDLRGDVAHVESYCLACHREERDDEKTDLVMALRYIDRFERRDGVWRIAHRLAVHDWSREDPVARDWPGAADVVRGRRDRDDPSYRR